MLVSMLSYFSLPGVLIDYYCTLEDEFEGLDDYILLALINKHIGCTKEALSEVMWRLRNPKLYFKLLSALLEKRVVHIPEARIIDK